MDNCLIVCSQNLECEALKSLPFEAVLESYAIAVDGGLKHLEKMGIEPKFWVGDNDSLLSKTKKAVEKSTKIPKATKSKKGYSEILLSKDKDYSDLECAFHVAGKAYLDGDWEGEVILLGAQGGRLDHELGNMLVAEKWLRELSEMIGPDSCPDVYSYGDKGIWVATVKEFEFDLPKGKMFSVFALDRSTKITIQGARYNVKDKSFEHASQGLSNEGMGKLIRISAKSSAVSSIFVMYS